MRFYALRLREAGLIKATPQKILADGTDWRFLNELKKELKASRPRGSLLAVGGWQEIGHPEAAGAAPFPE